VSDGAHILFHFNIVL